MKKSSRSKMIVGVVCFLLGFFTHLFLTRANFHYSPLSHEDRIPVSPEEFDQTHMNGDLEQRFGLDRQHSPDIEVENFDLSPKRREDDKFVYYEIQTSKYIKDNKIIVQIKDGYIHLSLEAKGENVAQSMEQVFSIDSNLDDAKAEVLNEKDKIIIRVPKKKA